MYLFIINLCYLYTQLTPCLKQNKTRWPTAVQMHSWQLGYCCASADRHSSSVKPKQTGFKDYLGETLFKYHWLKHIICLFYCIASFFFFLWTLRLRFEDSFRTLFSKQKQTLSFKDVGFYIRSSMFSSICILRNFYVIKYFYWKQRCFFAHPLSTDGISQLSWMHLKREPLWQKSRDPEHARLT